MKKIVYILLLCLPMLSCQDASSLMDKEDVGDLYEKDVFRSGTYARYFVNDIYYNIISTGYGVSGWGGAYMDCATDNGEARPLNSAAHRYNTGNWNAADNPLGFIWTNSYAQIRACNDAIPGEEISEKISRMELIVRRIFERAEAHPEVVPDLKKLMDYYLPMTVKLLNAYADMDAQPVQGENIQASKKEIEATLDTLNLAFEKLLDDLFRDSAMDVSSDISVLNTLLAQEGLTEDGLSQVKKQQTL